VTGGVVAAALETKAIAAIVNALAYVIAPVHITLSLPCGEQKRQNPPREVLGNHHRKSPQRWMELQLCLSD